MKVKILVLVCLGLLTAVPVLAQTRTVTNAELEKFRQKRVQAEQDYRDNYEKMGFVSPEEMQRQMETSRVERDALAARLAEERLQRERIAADIAIALITSEPRNVPVQDDSSYFGGDGFYGYRGSIYHGGRIFRGRNNYRYPTTIGNGIPIVDFGLSPRAPVRTRARFLRPR